MSLDDPGTRSMSPNEQKMTFPSAATASARSICSSGVTHTGQPGPWMTRTFPGNSRSMPLRMSVCVCPPHTSMTDHGRVAVRAIEATSARARSGSRYSSRYFMVVPQLAHLAQHFKQALGLGGVEPADGDAGVDDDVLADLRLGHARQTH